MFLLYIKFKLSLIPSFSKIIDVYIAFMPSSNIFIRWYVLSASSDKYSLQIGIIFFSNIFSISLKHLSNFLSILIFSRKILLNILFEELNFKITSVSIFSLIFPFILLTSDIKTFSLILKSSIKIL